TWVVELSGGQRQRLALGIAILPRPRILILDEPTTGLDPNARRDLWKILEDFKATGTTLLLTTHYMEEAEFLCERIVMLDQGKILADGTLN
ncbi:MAG: AAA family ATPase, partial [SAR324 cluster bacterium]|nr:AAA family ATPase [SAR324 cluster bacterium]